MIPRSNISWTDYSGGDLNFVLRGSNLNDCVVSPGCANCYAGAILRRNSKTSPITTWSEKKLGRLSKWQPECSVPYRRGEGARPLAFVCDMGDLFHEAVPNKFILDAVFFMAGRQDVDWQILTKRPRRMYNLLNKLFTPPPDNIWLGTTVEDQIRAEERIRWLAKTPAAVRFLSVEPLLEPLNLREWLQSDYDGGPPIDWVIVGGESGTNRRRFDPSWAASLRQQCRDGNVAFFYKQGSGLRPGSDDLLDGEHYKAFPFET